MANVHAAIKEIRKSARKRERNQAVLSELHSLWRKLNLLATRNPSEAKSVAQTLTSKWDRAVSRGMIPKGRADRKKARLAHLLSRANPKSR